MRVLFIDDDRSLGALYEALFRSRGHEIQAYETASSAISASSVFKPDVIVIDVNLPMLSGDRVLGIMKQQPAFKRVPFVLHSSRAEHELSALAYSAGADYSIPKSLGSFEFIGQLEKFMEGWR